MHPFLFYSHLLAIAMEKIDVIVVAFVYLEHKQISPNKSTQSCKQYPCHNYDRLSRNDLPCDREESLFGSFCPTWAGGWTVKCTRFARYAMYPFFTYARSCTVSGLWQFKACPNVITTPGKGPSRASYCITTTLRASIANRLSLTFGAKVRYVTLRTPGYEGGRSSPFFIVFCYILVLPHSLSLSIGELKHTSFAR